MSESINPYDGAINGELVKGPQIVMLAQDEAAALRTKLLAQRDAKIAVENQRFEILKQEHEDYLRHIQSDHEKQLEGAGLATFIRLKRRTTD